LETADARIGAVTELGNVGGARWFFLEGAPEAGEARLEREDERHALRVLRLGAGDEIVGIDGRGGCWPLAVAEVRRDDLVLAQKGPAVRVPRPGEPGAAIPSVEVAVCAPKGPRAEELLDRLVQLGVDRVTWLVTKRSQGFDRERIEGRAARWTRVAKEACKQARRAWMPELRGPEEAAGLVRREKARIDVLLSPRAALGLSEALRRIDGGGAATGSIRLLVGPEGGWEESELGELRSLGVDEASLGPHVLRVETAAEAAAAVAVDTMWRRSPAS
jgi:16S rRNA (uracil1498-N3)-methyltransferase